MCMGGNDDTERLAQYMYCMNTVYTQGTLGKCRYTNHNNINNCRTGTGKKHSWLISFK